MKPALKLPIILGSAAVLAVSALLLGTPAPGTPPPRPVPRRPLRGQERSPRGGHCARGRRCLRLLARRSE